MNKRLYVGWRRPVVGGAVFHYFVGDGIGRSTGICGRGTYHEPMEKRTTRHRSPKCPLCVSVLSARERNCILPLIVIDRPTP